MGGTGGGFEDIFGNSTPMNNDAFPAPEQATDNNEYADYFPDMGSWEEPKQQSAPKPNPASSTTTGDLFDAFDS